MRRDSSASKGSNFDHYTFRFGGWSLKLAERTILYTMS